MRKCQISATLLLALLLAGPQARAADLEVITLSCDGVLTDTYFGRLDKPDPEPIQKMGVVVNLDERWASLLASPMSMRPISTLADRKSAAPTTGTASTSRAIDRLTGHMNPTTSTANPTKKSHDPNGVMSHYDVLCKAANRVF